MCHELVLLKQLLIILFIFFPLKTLKASWFMFDYTWSLRKKIAWCLCILECVSSIYFKFIMICGYTCISSTVFMH